MNRWVAGARPRTLGAAVAPVVVGTALANAYGPTIWWRAAAALVVGVSMQVGANYANDYSDGVRGTDTVRAGPLRITAAGLATPSAVRLAAALSFAVAGFAGLALAIAVDWRLLVVGALAFAGAVLYTGGPRPYGYSGLGELAVLIFFGFVATLGSAYVQLHRVPVAAVAAAMAVGLLGVALLVTNNLRDIATDTVSGKRTLAVRIGDRATRHLYAACVVGSFVALAALAVRFPWALIGLAAAPLAIAPLRTVYRFERPPELIPTLAGTVRVQMVMAALLAGGLWVS
jgi:1,4-dihydroxy-2-naphthoate octaprenyltransferase